MGIRIIVCTITSQTQIGYLISEELIMLKTTNS